MAEFYTWDDEIDASDKLCRCTKKEIFWAVLMIQPFEFASLITPGVETKVITNMTGFLPVYNSAEEALNAWPAARVFPIGKETEECSCGGN